MYSIAVSLGLFNSGTDYSIYEAAHMKGLDLLFFKRFSLYHTNRDAVPSLEGANPLWNMMESALVSGIALTESDSSVNDNDSAVYFDRKWFACWTSFYVPTNLC
jgi:hypothetical protein